MPITSLFLTLGDEVFVDMEVPEQITGLGGSQMMAEHRFPGGIVTQQRFGAFPIPVSWRGIFTRTAALARMREVDRLRVAGEEVILSYGNTFLAGTVTEFVAEPRHQWLVPYHIVFQPRLDFSATSPLDDFLSTFQLINDAIGQLSTMLKVVFGPTASGPRFSAIDDSQQFYVSLPPSITPYLTVFVNDTVDALQAALGLPTEIPFSDAQQIYADAVAVLAQTLPLTLSSDPTISSPALDVTGYVRTVVLCLQNPSASNVTTLDVVNPNLSRIAAQYYGDATKWQIISDASGISPPDMLPLGQFTLTIPALVHG